MQIWKHRSCPVLLWLPPLDLAAVMSILAALMLWSSSVDPPPAGPSMCMKNQVTPVTCLSSHHLDGCNNTQQGWRGCVLGMGSRQSSPGFVSIEAGRSLGKILYPSTLSYSTSQCLLLPSMNKGSPTHPVSGQYSEPTGAICCTLVSAGKEGESPGSSEFTGRQISVLLFILKALDWWVSPLVRSPTLPFKLLCGVTAKVLQDQHL